MDLQKLLFNEKFLPRFFQKAGRRRHRQPHKGKKLLL